MTYSYPIHRRLSNLVEVYPILTHRSNDGIYSSPYPIGYDNEAAPSFLLSLQSPTRGTDSTHKVWE